MLADESQPGALREIAFQQRPGVHIPERARALAAQFVYELRELLQPFAQDIVIIGVAGIAGDEARIGESLSATGDCYLLLGVAASPDPSGALCGWTLLPAGVTEQLESW